MAIHSKIPNSVAIHSKNLFAGTAAPVLLFCTRATYATALEESLQAELEMYLYYSIGDPRQRAGASKEHQGCQRTADARRSMSIARRHMQTMKRRTAAPYFEVAKRLAERPSDESLP